MITHKMWAFEGNGLGAIPLVLKGTATVPARHRVLVPWLCHFFSPKDHVESYIILRGVSIGFALWMSHLYFGNPLGTSLLAVFLMWSALYDYTDGYIEVGLIALALYLMPTERGSIQWLSLGIISLVAVLNRESGLIIPVIAFMNGTVVDGVWCAAFAVMGYIIPRIKYGEGKRYCKFNMIRENIERIKGKRGRSLLLHDQYNHFFLLSLIIWICYGYGFIQGTLTPFDYLMMVFYWAMLVPSIWMEIRVFSPMMLSVIPIAMRGLN